MIKHKITYYPNFTIESFIEYNNDIIISESHYFPSGKIKEKITYEEGKLIKHIRINNDNDNNQIQTFESIDNDGIIFSIKFDKNNILEKVNPTKNVTRYWKKIEEELFTKQNDEEWVKCNNMHKAYYKSVKMIIDIFHMQNH